MPRKAFCLERISFTKLSIEYLAGRDFPQATPLMQQKSARKEGLAVLPAMTLEGHLAKQRF
ncbi:hypothetical protein BTN82_07205 [Pseudomonas chlororaphis]|uniref:Uncharacterized protein n=1 Tax=Pseudomonas chlororaphis TaxID=587753 RepID=A0A1Q8EU94_9PSED|nr:hypothetical protein BTN82_07205 [Pseudomonas chlororaphis]